MEGTLNSILDGSDTEVEQVEAVETEETEQAETGEVVEAAPEPEKEPEKPASVTPTDEPDDVKGLKAALKAERRKRQQAEQQAQAQAFDPSVFYQDPAHIQTFVEQRMSAQAINISREFAKQQFADYEEMEELFADEAERNPALIQELRNHPAPALFAYQTAKHLKTVQEAQDGSLEARIRAEVEAKIRAEYEAKKPATQVPPDLAGARSVPGNDSPPDESIDSILSRKR